MRGGDGRGDGQAEAVAVTPACAARPEPLEGLEQPVDLGRRDDLPGVGHQHHGAGVARPGGDEDIPACDVMPDGVVDQIRDQLVEQQRVAQQHRRLQIAADVQAEAVDPGARDDSAAIGLTRGETDWSFIIAS